MNDFAFDAAMDALATEDPEHRTRGLSESPSRFLLRTNFQTVAPASYPAGAARSAVHVEPGAEPHDNPDGSLSSLPSGPCPLTSEAAADGSRGGS